MKHTFAPEAVLKTGRRDDQTNKLLQIGYHWKAQDVLLNVQRKSRDLPQAFVWHLTKSVWKQRRTKKQISTTEDTNEQRKSELEKEKRWGGGTLKVNRSIDR